MERKNKLNNMLEENPKRRYIQSTGAYKNYQQKQAESIKASQKIRCDINLEHDPFKMLDLSLLCISIMTGDTEFYNQNKEKLINIICNWEIISKKQL